jgi:hypothetical protein
LRNVTRRSLSISFGIGAALLTDLFSSYRRRFVVKHRRDVTVYTGGHGVLELADKDGDNVEIYLHPEGKLLPVPL